MTSVLVRPVTKSLLLSAIFSMSGFATGALALETITLDNVVMDNGEKGTATVRKVEIVGTNLTKDEVQKLFTVGTPKEEGVAILKKMVASRIDIPEAVISNKEGKVTISGMQATDVKEGRVGHAAMAGFDGAFTSENGPVSLKSGPLAVDGAGLTGILSAVQTGDMGGSATQFGHISWQGLEVTAPDKDTPASTPGGNIVKFKLGALVADGTAEGDVPLKTKGEIKGLTVELPPGSAGGQSLKAAGFDVLSLGFTFASDYNPAQKSFAIDDFTVTGANMGSLGLKLKLGSVDKTLFTGATAERTSAIMAGNVSGLELKFVNGGLAEKALAFAAAQQGMPPEALKAQASAMANQFIPAMLGGNPVGLKIAEQVSSFINNPKTLTVSATPKGAPLAFTEAFGLMDPSAFLNRIDVMVLAQADGAAPAAPPAAAPVPAAPAATPAAPPAAAAAPPRPAASAAPAATQKLTGLAAWNVLVGNSISGKNEDGDPIVEYYLANGTVKQLVDDEISTGKWAVRGKTVCFEYPDDDDETCYEVAVDGTVATFTDEDGSGRRYEILKGNPKKL